ncbi:hypothetical protein KEM54_004405 [Ascosphaera aggregata]|nr:hypothetical protein KEM54_004405 [Ascosphaera aggregata]
MISHDIDAPITAGSGGPILARSLPSAHAAPRMSPSHARPHSAGNSEYSMFLSSTVFPGATEATASPYSDLQNMALGYNTVTAQTSPLCPLEDLMPPTSGVWVSHDDTAHEPLQPFDSECHHADMQYRLIPYSNDFTVHSALKQEWVELNDPVPMTSTGQHARLDVAASGIEVWGRANP